MIRWPRLLLGILFGTAVLSAAAGPPVASRPTTHAIATTRRSLDVSPTYPKPTDDWPMFRGSARQAGVAGTTLPDDLKLLWKTDTSDAISSTAAIVGGVVYVGNDEGAMLALDLVDGKQKWKFPTADAVRSSPTVVRLAPPASSRPAAASRPAADRLVVFGDESGKIYALDAETGKQRWIFEAEGPVISSANPLGPRGPEKDAAGACSALVVGSYDSFLYCLSAADGACLWKYQSADRVHGSPAVAGDVALFAGCDSHLHAVRISDGTRADYVELGSVTGSSVAAPHERAFMGTYGNEVLAIDFRADRVAWRYAPGEEDDPFLSSAAVTKTAVFIGGRDKGVHAIDPATGKQRWMFATRGRVDSSPIVAGNRVYVGSNDGILYGLDAETGREAWRYEIGAPISASPAAGAHRLVVGAEDGFVYCFGSR